MADAPFDPEQFIRKITEAGQRVRFGSGVVGKTSYAVVAVLGMWAVIVWRIGSDWRVDIALLVAGLIGTVAFIWWTRATQTFAERNPAQAMLDGTQFIEYQRLEATIKGGYDPAKIREQDEVKPGRRLPSS